MASTSTGCGPPLCREPLRRELAIPPLSPVVLYVGRNARVKNIPRLLDVVRQLLQTTPEAHVVLAGDGLDRRLVDGTDLASASRLHCLGPRGDIPSLLHDATLLLLTSDSEGMPNVVLEALAAGVPVVATAVGDLAQMLPEECGVLVPCDTEPLVAAVRRVIADAPSFAAAVEQVPRTVCERPIPSRRWPAGTVAVWRARPRGAIADRLTNANASPYPQHADTRKRINATYPLRAFRRAIRQRGIDRADFPSADVDAQQLRCPDPGRRALEGSAEGRNQSGSVLDTVRRYRDAVATLVWLDTTRQLGHDHLRGAAVCRPLREEPAAERSNQVHAPFYGMRCYTEFYHQSRGHRGHARGVARPGAADDLHKLAVSWNLGLGGYVRRTRQLMRPPRTACSVTGRFQSIGGDGRRRTTPLGPSPSASGDESTTTERRSLSSDVRRSVGWQRSPGRPASRWRMREDCTMREYRDEMRHSRLVLSPFGFGEINAGGISNASWTAPCWSSQT